MISNRDVIARLPRNLINSSDSFCGSEAKLVNVATTQVVRVTNAAETSDAELESEALDVDVDDVSTVPLDDCIDGVAAVGSSTANENAFVQDTECDLNIPEPFEDQPVYASKEIDDASSFNLKNELPEKPAKITLDPVNGKSRNASSVQDGPSVQIDVNGDDGTTTTAKGKVLAKKRRNPRAAPSRKPAEKKQKPPTGRRVRVSKKTPANPNESQGQLPSTTKTQTRPKKTGKAAGPAVKSKKASAKDKTAVQGTKKPYFRKKPPADKKNGKKDKKLSKDAFDLFALFDSYDSKVDGSSDIPPAMSSGLSFATPAKPGSNLKSPYKNVKASKGGDGKGSIPGELSEDLSIDADGKPRMGKTVVDSSGNPRRRNAGERKKISKLAPSENGQEISRRSFDDPGPSSVRYAKEIARHAVSPGRGRNSHNSPSHEKAEELHSSISNTVEANTDEETSREPDSRRRFQDGNKHSTQRHGDEKYQDSVQDTKKEEINIPYNRSKRTNSEMDDSPELRRRKERRRDGDGGSRRRHRDSDVSDASNNSEEERRRMRKSHKRRYYERRNNDPRSSRGSFSSRSRSPKRSRRHAEDEHSDDCDYRDIATSSKGGQPLSEAARELLKELFLRKIRRKHRCSKYCEMHYEVPDGDFAYEQQQRKFGSRVNQVFYESRHEYDDGYFRSTRPYYAPAGFYQGSDRRFLEMPTEMSDPPAVYYPNVQRYLMENDLSGLTSDGRHYLPDNALLQGMAPSSYDPRYQLAVQDPFPPRYSECVYEPISRVHKDVINSAFVGDTVAVARLPVPTAAVPLTPSSSPPPPPPPLRHSMSVSSKARDEYVVNEEREMSYVRVSGERRDANAAVPLQNAASDSANRERLLEKAMRNIKRDFRSPPSPGASEYGGGFPESEYRANPIYPSDDYSVNFRSSNISDGVVSLGRRMRRDECDVECVEILPGRGVQQHVPTGLHGLPTRHVNEDKSRKMEESYLPRHSMAEIHGSGISRSGRYYDASHSKERRDYSFVTRGSHAVVRSVHEAERKIPVLKEVVDAQIEHGVSSFNAGSTSKEKYVVSG
ncbi:unnamed protein product [Notodromas monacha]|uniref:Uncharacterized protein n=1 Tax=Notodromas monacha TaxID=399045 RepID=A0A7R9BMQ4_9CRUS|nr:unnamed protein product [Notodromas monacha]CAG0917247.1 unnamed protein product [Notodromas monacha]